MMEPESHERFWKRGFIFGKGKNKKKRKGGGGECQAAKISSRRKGGAGKGRRSQNRTGPTKNICGNWGGVGNEKGKGKERASVEREFGLRHKTVAAVGVCRGFELG